MLNAASRVKGERDWQKYEKARKLHRIIDKLRHSYIEDWKSKEMKVRQRAVAIYFIDKLALRAGNEKDERHALGGLRPLTGEGLAEEAGDLVGRRKAGDDDLGRHQATSLAAERAGGVNVGARAAGGGAAGAAAG